MTLHAALAIGAPIVVTLTEGSVQSSPTSRAYCPRHPDRQAATASGEANHDSTCDVGNRRAYGVWTRTEGSVHPSVPNVARAYSPHSGRVGIGADARVESTCGQRAACR